MLRHPIKPFILAIIVLTWTGISAWFGHSLKKLPTFDSPARAAIVAVADTEEPDPFLPWKTAAISLLSKKIMECEPRSANGSGLDGIHFVARNGLYDLPDMIVVESHIFNGRWDGMPVVDAYLWNDSTFSAVEQLRTFPTPRFHLDSSGIITGNDGQDNAVKMKWNGDKLDTIEDIEFLDLHYGLRKWKTHDHRTGKSKTWSERKPLPPEYNDGNYTLFMQGPEKNKP